MEPNLNEAELVALCNTILVCAGLNASISTSEEVTSICSNTPLFVAATEGILQRRIDGIQRRPSSISDRVYNCNTVINKLSQVLNMDLSHISGARIVQEESMSDIHNLLEILAALGETCLQMGHPKGASQEEVGPQHHAVAGRVRWEDQSQHLAAGSAPQGVYSSGAGSASVDILPAHSESSRDITPRSPEEAPSGGKQRDICPEPGSSTNLFYGNYITSLAEGSTQPYPSAEYRPGSTLLQQVTNTRSAASQQYDAPNLVAHRGYGYEYPDSLEADGEEEDEEQRDPANPTTSVFWGDSSRSDVPRQSGSRRSRRATWQASQPAHASRVSSRQTSWQVRDSPGASYHRVGGGFASLSAAEGARVKYRREGPRVSNSHAVVEQAVQELLRKEDKEAYRDYLRREAFVGLPGDSFDDMSTYSEDQEQQSRQRGVARGSRQRVSDDKAGGRLGGGGPQMEDRVLDEEQVLQLLSMLNRIDKRFNTGLPTSLRSSPTRNLPEGRDLDEVAAQDRGGQYYGRSGPQMGAESRYRKVHFNSDVEQKGASGRLKKKSRRSKGDHKRLGSEIGSASANALQLPNQASLTGLPDHVIMAKLAHVYSLCDADDKIIAARLRVADQERAARERRHSLSQSLSVKHLRAQQRRDENADEMASLLTMRGQAHKSRVEQLRLQRLFAEFKASERRRRMKHALQQELATRRVFMDALEHERCRIVAQRNRARIAAGAAARGSSSSTAVMVPSFDGDAEGTYAKLSGVLEGQVARERRRRVEAERETASAVRLFQDTRAAFVRQALADQLARIASEEEAAAVRTATNPKAEKLLADRMERVLRMNC